METLTHPSGTITAPAGYAGLEQQFIAGLWQRGRSEKVNKIRLADRGRAFERRD